MCEEETCSGQEDWEPEDGLGMTEENDGTSTLLQMSEMLFLTQTLIVDVTCNNNGPVDIKTTSALIQDLLTAA